MHLLESLDFVRMAKLWSAAAERSQNSKWNFAAAAPTTAASAVEAELRAFRAEEFALYQRVLDAGGHLQQYNG